MNSDAQIQLELPRNERWYGGRANLVTSLCAAIILSFLHHHYVLGSELTLMQSFNLVYSTATVFQLSREIIEAPMYILMAVSAFAPNLGMFISSGYTLFASPVIFAFWFFAFIVTGRVARKVFGAKLGLGISVVTFVLLITLLVVPLAHTTSNNASYISRCLNGEYMQESGLGGPSGCMASYIMTATRDGAYTKEQLLSMCMELSSSAKVTLDNQDEIKFLPGDMSHQEYCIYKIALPKLYPLREACSDYQEKKGGAPTRCRQFEESRNKYYCAINNKLVFCNDL